MRSTLKLAQWKINVDVFVIQSCSSNIWYLHIIVVIVFCFVRTKSGFYHLTTEVAWGMLKNALFTKLELSWRWMEHLFETFARRNVMNRLLSSLLLYQNRSKKTYIYKYNIEHTPLRTNIWTGLTTVICLYNLFKQCSRISWWWRWINGSTKLFIAIENCHLFVFVSIINGLFVHVSNKIATIPYKNCKHDAKHIRVFQSR